MMWTTWITVLFKVLCKGLTVQRFPASELRLKQSMEQMKAQKTEENADICSSSSDQQGPPEQSQKPSLEDTLEALLTRLEEKRQALGLPDNMKVRHRTDTFPSQAATDSEHTPDALLCILTIESCVCTTGL